MERFQKTMRECKHCIIFLIFFRYFNIRNFGILNNLLVNLKKIFFNLFIYLFSNLLFQFLEFI